MDAQETLTFSAQGYFPMVAPLLNHAAATNPSQFATMPRKRESDPRRTLPGLWRSYTNDTNTP
jgi:hypothetical protein